MKKWVIGKCDSEKVNEFCGKCDIDRLALEVLSARGAAEFEQIVDYFTQTELEDPFTLKDMDKAVEAVNEAIEKYDLICIYGDYDCDGVTSTAILFNFLESIGANVMYYIPERADGYGMNIAAVESLAEQGVKLIITVDNGISSIEEAKRIYELDMKLVVTDHHQPGEELPRAEAVVDPHRKDCMSSFKELCGAGVALKFCAALDEGSYDIVLQQYADICAIGTIQDSVSLTGENRTIVKNGLRLMANTEVAGLNAMLDKMNVDRSKIVSDSVGYRLGPVINASGRFGSPLTAVKALLSEDPEEAGNYVDDLIQLNNVRKQTEAEIMSAITKYINKHGEALDHRVLVLAGKNWHHGVIGIVASRTLEIYSKPTIIISIEDNGEARGSARSVKGFNMHSVLTYCKDVLIKFGGHECAGGFSLMESDIPRFRELVYEFAAKCEKAPVAFLNADKLLMPQDLTVERIMGLDALEPTGAGNPKPAFAILGARVEKIISLSQGKHTKIEFNYGGVTAQTPMFGQDPEKVYFKVGDKLDMLVNLCVNSFNGRETPEVHLIDYRLSGVKQERYFAAKDTYEKLMRGEELPVSFVKKIIPSREELVRVYKFIKSYGTMTLDTLFMRMADDDMNYCKLHICTDIFRDKELIEFKPASSKIKLLPVDKRVDLEDSQTLVRLRTMLERRDQI